MLIYNKHLLNEYLSFKYQYILLGSMKRAILLQTDATDSKKSLLNNFSIKACKLANYMLRKRKSFKLMDLHKDVYIKSKKRTKFNSQVICDIERSIVKSQGKHIDNITVKFNIPRNCKIFETKKYTFVRFALYSKKHIVVPFKKNRNFQRYKSLLEDGWICKTYGLINDDKIVAFLSKDKEIKERKNILGVDINNKYFAISIINPEGRVLKQTYFGRNLWIKRNNISLRRSVLQRFADNGSGKAIHNLNKIRFKERNFVKNKIGEIVRDITNLALRYDANIAIENLKKFKRKGKEYNKKVLKIPFYIFRKNLENRCFDKNIKLNIINPFNTSKWCSHCGAVADKGHDSENYTLFKCECGLEVNSDRKASLAVAVKSLLARIDHTTKSDYKIQIAGRRVHVNGLLSSKDKQSINTVYSKSAFRKSCLIY